MPSRCEGLALTALEATSLGIPMVLTPVGGNGATFPAEWLVGVGDCAWSERFKGWIRRLYRMSLHGGGRMRNDSRSNAWQIA